MLRSDNHLSMENFVKQTLLYDFYGDLLTDHQKEIYEAYALDNLSLAEMANEFGISRQGVHDIIKRVNASLEEYEKKLGLVKKFLKVKEEVARIQESSDIEKAKKIATKILEEL